MFGQYAAVLGNVFCRIRSWHVFILMYSIENVTYWARIGAHKCLARPSCDPCHEFHYICSISAKPRSWPNQRVNGVSVPYSHVFRDGWDMADQTEPKRWAESKRASTLICVHKHARTHTHTHTHTNTHIYRQTHIHAHIANIHLVLSYHIHCLKQGLRLGWPRPRRIGGVFSRIET